MKSEERITIQRDWLWSLSREFEQKAEQGGPTAAADLNLAHEFALAVGTLDWVLGEDFVADVD